MGHTEPPASDPALRPAAQLLVLEGEALLGVVRPLTAEDFDLPTACSRWSVRDVLAHCSAVLHRLVAGVGGMFDPQENQQDVDLRATWTTDRVIDELTRGCAKAPIIIH
ncbi:MAG: maleylpyruvate isomerase N-terminal domain-containing protein, partial [Acidimicrobiia bacterium]